MAQHERARNLQHPPALGAIRDRDEDANDAGGAEHTWPCLQEEARQHAISRLPLRPQDGLINRHISRLAIAISALERELVRGSRTEVLDLDTDALCVLDAAASGLSRAAASGLGQGMCQLHGNRHRTGNEDLIHAPQPGIQVALAVGHDQHAPVVRCAMADQGIDHQSGATAYEAECGIERWIHQEGGVFVACSVDSPLS
mmetsp:Transcript_176053/g.564491  ORF Transcript_176053/g.564491 Transcript_176053/m.564491 type:complete len:200 (-) Transcript_176053:940-1539(-)